MKWHNQAAAAIVQSLDGIQWDAEKAGRAAAANLDDKTQADKVLRATIAKVCEQRVAEIIRRHERAKKRKARAR